MLKLNLKYLSTKDNNHYFVVNNSDVLTEEYHNFEVDHNKYYPFFKGDKGNGDIILKIKDKYLNESNIPKDSPRDALIHLKDFRLQDKATKKLKLGLFVDEVVFYDKAVGKAHHTEGVVST